MARVFIDIEGGRIKRGDIVQSNCGNRRERTWMVLKARRQRNQGRGWKPRFTVWMARWWELEPETRMRLFRSAERNGGQRVVYFERYKPKRRPSFEHYIRRRAHA